MTFHEIHPKFKLNGHSYTKEELSEVAYSLVKEGLPYEQRIGDFLMDWLNNKEQIAMRYLRFHRRAQNVYDAEGKNGEFCIDHC